MTCNYTKSAVLGLFVNAVVIVLFPFYHGHIQWVLKEGILV